MFGYIIRRLISAFLVVVLASMFVFALFAFGPTNPAAYFCSQNGRCTQERQALLEDQLGLNDPIADQYATWVKGLFVDRTITMGGTYHCDAPCLGISYVTQLEVRKQLTKKFPATLSIAIGGSALYLTLGMLLGSLAARWRGTAADRLLVTGSIAVSSVPYYLLCLLAWIYLTLVFHVFPTTGYFPITDNPVKWFEGLLLPWLVVGTAYSTLYARFGRGAMIEALGEDYVRSATAKGVSRNKATFVHALRAAIVPIVTLFGLSFAGLLSGTIFTEKIFDIDGVGKFTIEAIPNDFPVISAAVLLTSVLVVIGNLIVDIAYSALDPRVRLV
ncbi:MAG: ABC transporter permease [Nocardioidaceae bacterium]